MTVTQPDPDSGMTRRGLMRRTALGIGATAGIGGSAMTLDNGPVQDADAIAVSGVIIGGVVVGAAATVAYGALISDPDEEAVADSLNWQAHVNEYTRAREDNLMLGQTLDSLSRDVQLVENKAREEAIFRIYEQGVDGGTEADATNAAETAINDAYATVQKGILNSWSIRSNRVSNIYQIFFDADAGSLGQYLRLYDQNGNYEDGTVQHSQNYFSDAAFNTTEVTLADGSALTLTGSNGSEATGWTYWLNPFTQPTDENILTEMTITKPDSADYDGVDEASPEGPAEVTLIDAERWYTILQDLETRRSNVISEVSSMVNTYFGPAQNGEIDLTDLRGPAHLTNTAKNASDFQEATMALRAMGFAIADQTSVVSFKQDGESYEVDGRIARTVQDPNDLPVGTELDPTNITGSVYGAFNVTNDAGEQTGEIFEINTPFTIETAEGESSVSFQTRTIVGSDSTLTNEEIQQIFAENYEANEDATENVYDTATVPSGGGGGGDLGSDQNWGLIAVGAGVVALGWGYITGDDQ